MKVLYFAWLRTHTGKSSEELAPPAGVDTVQALVDWLKDQGPDYAKAFADTRTVKVAVNQTYVPYSHPVAAGDEVAFFPPVTGG